jgi:hypothetical protein
MRKSTISRRQLLAASAGVALVGALAPKGVFALASQQGRGKAREVLTHDSLHGVSEFSRSQLDGPTLDGSSLRGPGRFTAPVIASGIAFTHVGLHWKGTGHGGGGEFELRTSEDGTSWTEWQRVFVEAHPEETPAGETYGALISAPRHRYLQYRGTQDDGGRISTVTATTLNSIDGPEISTQASVASVTSKPIGYTREAWGADERLRFRGKGEIWPRMYVPVKKLVVHHTATSNSYATVDAAMAEIRSIYTYHAKTLGWGDIGYNALVDKWGNTYEGRYGRGGFA